MFLNSSTNNTFNNKNLELLLETAEEIIDFNSVEDKKEITNDNQKSVYIILTYTSTLFAKITKFLFKDRYTHASISLDKTLNNMYTCDLFNNGFKKESIKEVLAKDEKRQFSVYRIGVSLDIYNKIKEVLNEFISGVKKVTYNIWGLFGILFNKPIKATDAYFCSEFVLTVLKKAGINIFRFKDISLVRPYDLAKTKKLKLLYRGSLKNFNPVNLI